MGDAEGKLARLKTLLMGLESAVVAFSGGVDSTFLLRTAVEVLGERVLAVTAVSETYLPGELEEARAMAVLLGVPHRVIHTAELENPAFVANPPDRCYHCKKELFSHLWHLARREGYRWVLDGSNCDDLQDYRPGRRAGQELGVRSPLCEAGLGKEDIRLLSRRMGLPTWDKPALACLSSRIPYGQPLTRERLSQVAEAERYLLAAGFRQVRVRHHGDIARVEVNEDHFDRAVALRREIVARLRDLGFTYVTLDLQGYRPGSLNESLKETQKV